MSRDLIEGFVSGSPETSALLPIDGIAGKFTPDELAVAWFNPPTSKTLSLLPDFDDQRQVVDPMRWFAQPDQQSEQKEPAGLFQIAKLEQRKDAPQLPKKDGDDTTPKVVAPAPLPRNAYQREALKKLQNDLVSHVGVIFTRWEPDKFIDDEVRNIWRELEESLKKTEVVAKLAEHAIRVQGEQIDVQTLARIGKILQAQDVDPTLAKAKEKWLQFCKVAEQLGFKAAEEPISELGLIAVLTASASRTNPDQRRWKEEWKNFQKKLEELGIKQPGKPLDEDARSTLVERLRSEKDRQLYGPATQAVWRIYIACLEYLIATRAGSMVAAGLPLRPGMDVAINSATQLPLGAPLAQKQMENGEWSFKINLKPPETTMPNSEQFDTMETVRKLYWESEEDLLRQCATSRDAKRDADVAKFNFPKSYLTTEADKIEPDRERTREAFDEVLELYLEVRKTVLTANFLHKLGGQEQAFPLRLPPGFKLNLDDKGEIQYTGGKNGRDIFSEKRMPEQLKPQAQDFEDWVRDMNQYLATYGAKVEQAYEMFTTQYKDKTILRWGEEPTGSRQEYMKLVPWTGSDTTAEVLTDTRTGAKFVEVPDDPRKPDAEHHFNLREHDFHVNRLPDGRYEVIPVLKLYEFSGISGELAYANWRLMGTLKADLTLPAIGPLEENKIVWVMSRSGPKPVPVKLLDDHDFWGSSAKAEMQRQYALELGVQIGMDLFIFLDGVGLVWKAGAGLCRRFAMREALALAARGAEAEALALLRKQATKEMLVAVEGRLLHSGVKELDQFLAKQLLKKGVSKELAEQISKQLAKDLIKVVEEQGLKAVNEAMLAKVMGKGLVDAFDPVGRQLLEHAKKLTYWQITKRGINGAAHMALALGGVLNNANSLDESEAHRERDDNNKEFDVHGDLRTIRHGWFTAHILLGGARPFVNTGGKLIGLHKTFPRFFHSADSLQEFISLSGGLWFTRQIPYLSSIPRLGPLSLQTGEGCVHSVSFVNQWLMIKQMWDHIFVEHPDTPLVKDEFKKPNLYNESEYDPRKRELDGYLYAICDGMKKSGASWSIDKGPRDLALAEKKVEAAKAQIQKAASLGGEQQRAAEKNMVLALEAESAAECADVYAIVQRAAAISKQREQFLCDREKVAAQREEESKSWTPAREDARTSFEKAAEEFRNSLQPPSQPEEAEKFAAGLRQFTGALEKFKEASKQCQPLSRTAGDELLFERYLQTKKELESAAAQLGEEGRSARAFTVAVKALLEQARPISDQPAANELFKKTQAELEQAAQAYALQRKDAELANKYEKALAEFMRQIKGEGSTAFVQAVASASKKMAETTNPGFNAAFSRLTGVIESGHLHSKRWGESENRIQEQQKQLEETIVKEFKEKLIKAFLPPASCLHGCPDFDRELAEGFPSFSTAPDIRHKHQRLAAALALLVLARDPEGVASSVVGEGEIADKVKGVRAFEIKRDSLIKYLQNEARLPSSAVQGLRQEDIDWLISTAGAKADRFANLTDANRLACLVFNDVRVMDLIEHTKALLQTPNSEKHAAELVKKREELRQKLAAQFNPPAGFMPPKEYLEELKKDAKRLQEEEKSGFTSYWRTHRPDLMIAVCICLLNLSEQKDGSVPEKIASGVERSDIVAFLHETFKLEAPQHSVRGMVVAELLHKLGHGKSQGGPGDDEIRQLLQEARSKGSEIEKLYAQKLEMWGNLEGGSINRPLPADLTLETNRQLLRSSLQSYAQSLTDSGGEPKDAKEILETTSSLLTARGDIQELLKLELGNKRQLEAVLRQLNEVNERLRTAGLPVPEREQLEAEQCRLEAERDQSAMQQEDMVDRRRKLEQQSGKALEARLEELDGQLKIHAGNLMQKLCDSSKLRELLNDEYRDCVYEEQQLKEKDPNALAARQESKARQEKAMNCAELKASRNRLKEVRLSIQEASGVLADNNLEATERGRREKELKALREEESKLQRTISSKLAAAVALLYISRDEKGNLAEVVAQRTETVPEYTYIWSNEIDEYGESAQVRIKRVVKEHEATQRLGSEELLQFLRDDFRSKETLSPRWGIDEGSILLQFHHPGVKGLDGLSYASRLQDYLQNPAASDQDKLRILVDGRDGVPRLAEMIESLRIMEAMQNNTYHGKELAAIRGHYAGTNARALMETISKLVENNRDSELGAFAASVLDALGRQDLHQSKEMLDRLATRLHQIKFNPDGSVPGAQLRQSFKQEMAAKLAVLAREQFDKDGKPLLLDQERKPVQPVSMEDKHEALMSAEALLSVYPPGHPDAQPAIQALVGMCDAAMAAQRVPLNWKQADREVYIQDVRTLALICFQLLVPERLSELNEKQKKQLAFALQGNLLYPSQFNERYSHDEEMRQIQALGVIKPLLAAIPEGERKELSDFCVDYLKRLITPGSSFPKLKDMDPQVVAKSTDGNRGLAYSEGYSELRAAACAVLADLGARESAPRLEQLLVKPTLPGEVQIVQPPAVRLAALKALQRLDENRLQSLLKHQLVLEKDLAVNAEIRDLIIPSMRPDPSSEQYRYALDSAVRQLKESLGNAQDLERGEAYIGNRFFLLNGKNLSDTMFNSGVRAFEGTKFNWALSFAWDEFGKLVATLPVIDLFTTSDQFYPGQKERIEKARQAIKEIAERASKQWQTLNSEAASGKEEAVASLLHIIVTQGDPFRVQDSPTVLRQACSNMAMRAASIAGRAHSLEELLKQPIPAWVLGEQRGTYYERLRLELENLKLGKASPLAIRRLAEIDMEMVALGRSLGKDEVKAKLERETRTKQLEMEKASLTASQAPEMTRVLEFTLLNSPMLMADARQNLLYGYMELCAAGFVAKERAAVVVAQILKLELSRSSGLKGTALDDSYCLQMNCLDYLSQLKQRNTIGIVEAVASPDLKMHPNRAVRERAAQLLADLRDRTELIMEKAVDMINNGDRRSVDDIANLLKTRLFSAQVTSDDLAQAVLMAGLCGPIKGLNDARLPLLNVILSRENATRFNERIKLCVARVFMDSSLPELRRRATEVYASISAYGSTDGCRAEACERLEKALHLMPAPTPDGMVAGSLEQEAFNGPELMQICSVERKKEFHPELRLAAAARLLESKSAEERAFARKVLADLISAINQQSPNNSTRLGGDAFVQKLLTVMGTRCPILEEAEEQHASLRQLIAGKSFAELEIKTRLMAFQLFTDRVRVPDLTGGDQQICYQALLEMCKNVNSWTVAASSPWEVFGDGSGQPLIALLSQNCGQLNAAQQEDIVAACQSVLEAGDKGDISQYRASAVLPVYRQFSGDMQKYSLVPSSATSADVVQNPFEPHTNYPSNFLIRPIKLNKNADRAVAQQTKTIVLAGQLSEQHQGDRKILLPVLHEVPPLPEKPKLAKASNELIEHARTYEETKGCMLKTFESQLASFESWFRTSNVYSLLDGKNFCDATIGAIRGDFPQGKLPEWASWPTVWSNLGSIFGPASESEACKHLRAKVAEVERVRGKQFDELCNQTKNVDESGATARRALGYIIATHGLPLPVHERMRFVDQSIDQLVSLVDSSSIKRTELGELFSLCLVHNPDLSNDQRCKLLRGYLELVRHEKAGAKGASEVGSIRREVASVTIAEALQSEFNRMPRVEQYGHEESVQLQKTMLEWLKENKAFRTLPILEAIVKDHPNEEIKKLARTMLIQGGFADLLQPLRSSFPELVGESDALRRSRAQRGAAVERELVEGDPEDIVRAIFAANPLKKDGAVQDRLYGTNDPRYAGLLQAVGHESTYVRNAACWVLAEALDTLPYEVGQRVIAQLCECAERGSTFWYQEDSRAILAQLQKGGNESVRSAIEGALFNIKESKKEEERFQTEIAQLEAQYRSGKTDYARLHQMLSDYGAFLKQRSFEGDTVRVRAVDRRAWEVLDKHWQEWTEQLKATGQDNPAYWDALWGYAQTLRQRNWIGDKEKAEWLERKSYDLGDTAFTFSDSRAKTSIDAGNNAFDIASRLGQHKRYLERMAQSRPADPGLSVEQYQANIRKALEQQESEIQRWRLRGLAELIGKLEKREKEHTSQSAWSLALAHAAYAQLLPASDKSQAQYSCQRSAAAVDLCWRKLLDELKSANGDTTLSYVRSLGAYTQWLKQHKCEPGEPRLLSSELRQQYLLNAPGILKKRIDELQGAGGGFSQAELFHLLYEYSQALQELDAKKYAQEIKECEQGYKSLCQISLEKPKNLPESTIGKAETTVQPDTVFDTARNLYAEARHLKKSENERDLAQARQLEESAAKCAEEGWAALMDLLQKVSKEQAASDPELIQLGRSGYITALRDRQVEESNKKSAALEQENAAAAEQIMRARIQTAVKEKPVARSSQLTSCLRSYASFLENRSRTVDPAAAPKVADEMKKELLQLLNEGGTEAARLANGINWPEIKDGRVDLYIANVIRRLAWTMEERSWQEELQHQKERGESTDETRQRYIEFLLRYSLYIQEEQRKQQELGKPPLPELIAISAKLQATLAEMQRETITELRKRQKLSAPEKLRLAQLLQERYWRSPQTAVADNEECERLRREVHREGVEANIGKDWRSISTADGLANAMMVLQDLQTAYQHKDLAESERKRYLAEMKRVMEAVQASAAVFYEKEVASAQKGLEGAKSALERAQRVQNLCMLYGSWSYTCNNLARFASSEQRQALEREAQEHERASVDLFESEQRTTLKSVEEAAHSKRPFDLISLAMARLRAAGEYEQRAQLFRQKQSDLRCTATELQKSGEEILEQLRRCDLLTTAESLRLAQVYVQLSQQQQQRMNHANFQEHDQMLLRARQHMVSAQEIMLAALDAIEKRAPGSLPEQLLVLDFCSQATMQGNEVLKKRCLQLAELWRAHRDELNAHQIGCLIKFYAAHAQRAYGEIAFLAAEQQKHSAEQLSVLIGTILELSCAYRQQRQGAQTADAAKEALCEQSQNEGLVKALDVGKLLKNHRFVTKRQFDLAESMQTEQLELAKLMLEDYNWRKLRQMPKPDRPVNGNDGLQKAREAVAWLEQARAMRYLIDLNARPEHLKLLAAEQQKNAARYEQVASSLIADLIKARQEELDNLARANDAKAVQGWFTSPLAQAAEQLRKLLPVSLQSEAAEMDAQGKKAAECIHKMQALSHERKLKELVAVPGYLAHEPQALVNYKNAALEYFNFLLRAGQTAGADKLMGARDDVRKAITACCNTELESLRRNAGESFVEKGQRLVRLRQNLRELNELCRFANDREAEAEIAFLRKSEHRWLQDEYVQLEKLSETELEETSVDNLSAIALVLSEYVSCERAIPFLTRNRLSELDKLEVRINELRARARNR